MFFGRGRLNQRIQFPAPSRAPEPLEKLVDKVHQQALYSERVFLCPHAREQMNKRNISTRQIFDVLRAGKGIEGPDLDQYGDWRIKLSRYSAGKSIKVVVVVKTDYLEVVTVF